MIEGSLFVAGGGMYLQFYRTKRAASGVRIRRERVCTRTTWKSLVRREKNVKHIFGSAVLSVNFTCIPHLPVRVSVVAWCMIGPVVCSIYSQVTIYKHQMER